MLRRLKDPNVEMLFKAMLSLETVEECYDFFEDICTVDEVQSIAKRLCAAKMLKDGMVYNEINEKTGLSTATISRVNRSMKYGNGGYDMVFERIKKEN
jgi:TrpR-related protein YerC/YecD